MTYTITWQAMALAKTFMTVRNCEPLASGRGSMHWGLCLRASQFTSS